MAVLFRWLFRLVTAALVLGLIAIGLVYYLASGSLPQYDKRLSVDGLNAEVEIVRDNAAVPHIMAQTDADAFFGLGYVHAQDRLWQMMILRRTVQGRLSELFGQRTLDTDILLRRLDLYGAARASVEDQTPEAKTALTAYAAGVNARIAEINRESLARGAPEFFLFNAPIAPWQPADSIAIVKLMSLELSNNASREVRRARLSLALDDADRVADILPDVPGQGVAALPDYASLVPDAVPWRPAEPRRHAMLWPLAEPGGGGASNAWAADPTRSAAGGTLLANDPHLGLSAPAIWYLARLELQTGGVIGAGIPGTPAIMLGRSARLGWGLTSSYLDDQDLALEELNPDNPEEYRTPTGWTPFETRRAIIEVADAEPVTITLRWTENGPVLPRSAFDLGTVTPTGHVMSLNWTALSPDDTSLSAAVGIMRVGSVAEALDVSTLYVAPSQNLTLADRETIALRTIGALPRRDARHQSQGRMPAPGWLVENRWLGTLPQSANPEFISPPGGIVGNTNNKVVDRPFPMHVSFDWGDSQRVQRWQAMMQGREVHTRDSFIEAQLDTVSPAARTLLPLMGRDLWFTSEAAPEGSAARQRARALALLAEWNGEMNEHLPEPLIYAAWLRALQDRLIRDELGPMSSLFTRPEPLFVERVFRNIDGAAAWCDVVQSAPTETCTEIARLALDDAFVWIDETWGPQLESLRWGDAHEATHDHPVLGEVPFLRNFVNIRQSTSGGDFTLMRGRTRGSGDDPFASTHAAGYRGVYDFGDPDSSVFVNATGQSGHFLSRHYDDLGQLWRRGEYIPMSLDIDLARAASVGVTTLVPE